jgi:CheY-like chemotaxis protein
LASLLLGDWRGRLAVTLPSPVLLAEGADSPSSCPSHSPRLELQDRIQDRPDPRAPARPLLLLVEDDRATSKALRGIFDRRGWDVLHAATVAEALSLLSADPKCVILDLMLPDGDGLTVLKKIRSENLPIRVVVTTGSNDPARIRAVSALRPEVFLGKPVSLHDLLAGLGNGP